MAKRVHYKYLSSASLGEGFRERRLHGHFPHLRIMIARNNLQVGAVIHKLDLEHVNRAKDWRPWIDANRLTSRRTGLTQAAAGRTFRSMFSAASVSAWM